MDEDALALDTNALSALMRRDRAVIECLGDRTPVLPIVVAQEAVQGWLLQAGRAEQRGREEAVGRVLDGLREVLAFVRNLALLGYTPAAQVVYRALRAGRGNIGRNDLRIAAICLAHDVPLLTRNTTDFQNIDELTLVAW